MASVLWNPYPAPMIKQNGNIAAGAKVYFTKDNTTTPLTVYRDSARSNAYTTHPVVANSNGIFPPIYLPYQTYRVRVETSEGVEIFDAGDIANPAPYEEAGGITVTESQIFQTGDPIWRMRSDPIEGWIRLNGRTIGAPGSGATERANDDCYDLYVYAWDHWPDNVAPVTSGRGASASADWLAGKVIQPRKMNGMAAIGNDDGGTGTATNVIQVATTCIATNGSPVIVVTSADGIAVGMAVYVNEVLAGFVLSISGLNVTVGANWTGATNGYNFRASFFGSPFGVGGTAGTPTTVMLPEQMPYHNHTVTPAGALSVVAGGAIQVAGGTGTIGAALEVGYAGLSQPQMNIQPSVLGVWYCKL
jgi:hypothetical protein